jgi:putative transposase
MVFHRQITKGFKVKTGTVIPKAEGGYISLTLEAQTVPVTLVEIQPTAENSIGIDVGISNYAYLSHGEQVENPRLLRQYSQKLARRLSKLASRVKGSKPGKSSKARFISSLNL